MEDTTHYYSVTKDFSNPKYHNPEMCAKCKGLCCHSSGCLISVPSWLLTLPLNSPEYIIYFPSFSIFIPISLVIVPPFWGTDNCLPSCQNYVKSGRYVLLLDMISVLAASSTWQCRSLQLSAHQRGWLQWQSLSQRCRCYRGLPR